MAPAEIHVQLSVDFGDDPKVRALARYGRDARGCRDLYVQMVCYAKRTLSDGWVPDEQVGVLVYPDPPKVGARDAGRLVDVGLCERGPTGYFMPGAAAITVTRRGDARPHIPVSTREIVYARDGHTCRACGRSDRLSLDHIKPYSKGGMDVAGNLRTLCLPCNQSRGPGRW